MSSTTSEQAKQPQNKQKKKKKKKSKEQDQQQQPPQTQQEQTTKRRGILIVICAVCGLTILLNALSGDPQISDHTVVKHSVVLNFGVEGSDADEEAGDEEDGSDIEFYCDWKSNGTLDGCFDLLSRRIEENKISGHQPWMYLGDSTMTRTMGPLFNGINQIGSIAPGVSVKLKHLRSNGDRCRSMDYLGLPALNNKIDRDNLVPWIPPNHSNSEGPVDFGATHSFCFDCSGCNPSLHSVNLESAGTTKQLTSIEYLPIEFAVDVSLPSKMARTTQETVVRYMHRKYQGNIDPKNSTQQKDRQAMCVVNTGIHDMIIPRITTEAYARNVLTYWTLLLTGSKNGKPLQPVCAQIIWISTSATLNYRAYLQKNDKIKKWNQAIFDLVSAPVATSGQKIDGLPTASFLREHVSIVDIFDKSLHTKHEDNVHLAAAPYYVPLSALFVKLKQKLWTESVQDSHE